MSTSNAISDALYTKLSAGTALTALVAGTAIWRTQAPEGAAFPYVVYSLQAGGPLNWTPSDMRDQVMFVRGYAYTASEAGSIDAAISTLLHQGSLAPTGYSVYWLARETDLESVEYPQNNRPVYMSGALYRIRMDS